MATKEWISALAKWRAGEREKRDRSTDMIVFCIALRDAMQNVPFQLESISWQFPPKGVEEECLFNPPPKFPMSSPPLSSTAPSPCRSSSTLIPTHVTYISIYAWLSPYSAFLFCILFLCCSLPFFGFFMIPNSLHTLKIRE